MLAPLASEFSPVQEAETGSSAPLTGFSCKITTPDGLDYWVTDRREEWKRLSDAGAIVFSAGEIQRISQMIGMAGDQTGNIAEAHIAAKRVFPGTYVSKVEDLRPTEG